MLSLKILKYPKNTNSKKSYGIVADTLQRVSGKVKTGHTLTDLLIPYVNYSLIHKMSKAVRGIFNLRSIKEGNTYSIYFSKDSVNTLKYFVIDEDMINYVVFKFGDTITVKKGKKEKHYELKVAESIIINFLYETLDKKILVWI